MEDSQPPSHTITSTTHIPYDLTVNILSRLPAKSLVRFQYVSKLWFSIIRNKDFTDKFLTLLKTRPRLLFTFKHFDSRKRFIFSSPEHDCNNDDKIIARHDMTISDLVYYIRSRPLNGFICCTRGSSIAVCNPTTRQIVKLPDVTPRGRDMYARLGYDPVQDQYKVLCVMMFDGRDSPTKDDIEQEHYVFTLSSGQKEWRKIETVTKDPYRCMKGEICMDGALYYSVGYARLARFDVRTEKVEFIQGPQDYNAVSIYSTLINHKGKLACVRYDLESYYEIWTLEDVEKQEWSSIMTCHMPSEWEDILNNERMSCIGEIHTNEVMIVSRSECLESSKVFSVYYYDFVEESMRKGEVDGIADSEFRGIHGIGKDAREMYCFPGHVENIMYL
ncbi:unnamed protein product [Cochlearia groenlandica]